MAFTSVPTVATGDVWSAANHNQYIKDNFAAIWVGSAAGDIDYYSSATAKTRLAKPSVDSLLKNTSAGVPTWKAITDLLSAPARQGGSSTVWSSAGTTNYSAAPTIIQMGVVSIAMAGSVAPAVGSASISFPNAFTYTPIVWLQVISSATSGVWVQCEPYNISTTGFTLLLAQNATASFYNPRSVHWLAIGG